MAYSYYSDDNVRSFCHNVKQTSNKVLQNEAICIIAEYTKQIANSRMEII